MPDLSRENLEPYLSALLKKPVRVLRLSLLGEKIETGAIKAVLGDHAYEIVVGSTKSILDYVNGKARFRPNNPFEVCRTSPSDASLPSSARTRSSVTPSFWATAAGFTPRRSCACATARICPATVPPSHGFASTILSGSRRRASHTFCICSNTTAAGSRCPRAHSGST